MRWACACLRACRAGDEADGRARRRNGNGLGTGSYCGKPGLIAVQQNVQIEDVARLIPTSDDDAWFVPASSQARGRLSKSMSRTRDNRRPRLLSERAQRTRMQVQTCEKGRQVMSIAVSWLTRRRSRDQ